MKKFCSYCKQDLPISSFGQNQRQHDGLQNYCFQCRSKYFKGWYKKRRESREFVEYERGRCRNVQLKVALKKYSLKPHDYRLLELKGCGICGGPPNGRGRYAFDHDHSTGRFRGLLCSRCNTAIGLLDDDPSLMMKAVRYVLRTKEGGEDAA